MQKFALKHGKFGAITRTWTLPTEQPKGIIVECSNGDEVPIRKIYSVGGRTSCIKILIDELLENPADLDEIHSLRTEVEQLEEENEHNEGKIEVLKDELEKWTDNFGDDPESTKTLWDEIEEAVRHFGLIAEINLVANDATNICRLQDEYEDKAKLLLEADEIIAELKEKIAALKVDNRALTWNIEQLETWKENTLKDENP